MPEAVQEAVQQLKTDLLKPESRQIVVHVVNRFTHKQDSTASTVEAELSRSLSQSHLHVISLAESRAGVPLFKVVMLKGEIEPKGWIVTLTLFATSTRDGSLLSSVKVDYSFTEEEKLQTLIKSAAQGNAAAQKVLTSLGYYPRRAKMPQGHF